MNERKIIDRKFLADLAKEVGLNASHLEALGETRQWEIVVDGDMLERLVEIQHRFERLAVMGDDEYSISKYHDLHRKSGGTPGQSVLRTGSTPVLSLRIVPRVRMQSQMIRGAGRT